MGKLLMSINPRYVDHILDGSKRYEYRKVRCKQPVESILIYSTAPVMKIVAEVEVKEVIEDTPQNIWEQTSAAAGIEKRFFDQYFQGKSSAVAYALGQIVRYSKPRCLGDFGIKTAPQSFMYIRNEG